MGDSFGDSPRRKATGEPSGYDAESGRRDGGDRLEIDRSQIDLSQSAIEVDIAAVHDGVLAGCVGGLRW